MNITVTGKLNRVCEKNGQYGPYLGVTVNTATGKVWFSRKTEEAIYNQDAELGFGTMEKAFFPGDDMEFTAEIKSTGDNIAFLKNVVIPGLDQPTQGQPGNGITLPADIPQGHFTVVFDDGEHRTLRINTVADGGRWDGWTFAKFLNGPDNTSNYANFASAKPGETEMRIKAQFRDDSKVAKALATLLGASEEERHEMGVAYAAISGNCYVCNRLLTEPESIKLGIGPVCRSQ